jgi:hypothetical protein
MQKISSAVLRKGGHRVRAGKPSTFSGHLLGNREGFLVRTAEVSIHPLHQFGSRQQPGGFDHCPLPMDPMRFQRVEPRAFAGQGTPHNPDALAPLFDLLVGCPDPLPDSLAAVPRGIIPHQQQSGLAQSGHLGTALGQEGDCDRTHGAVSHEPQPPLYRARPLERLLLHQ